MIGAFLIGLALQAAVTEFAPLISLFGTVRLGLAEWLQLIALSAVPLIVHELLAAVGPKRRIDSAKASNIGGGGGNRGYGAPRVTTDSEMPAEAGTGR